MNRATFTLGVGIVVALLATAFLSAGYTGHKARQVFAAELDATQAQTWFDELKALEQIESILARGCNDAALEQVKIDVDGKMRLLSTYIRDGGDPATLKYISERDASIISRLKTFKSKYGSVWEVPTCGSERPGR